MAKTMVCVKRKMAFLLSQDDVNKCIGESGVGFRKHDRDFEFETQRVQIKYVFNIVELFENMNFL